MQSIMDCFFSSMLHLHCFFFNTFSVSYCFACLKFQILFYNSQSVNFTKSNNKKRNDLITLYSKPLGIFTMHFFYRLFSHILLWKDCAKICIFSIWSSNFFLSDLVLFKEQLILIFYERMRLKEGKSKWKMQQTWVAYHKFKKKWTLVF